MNKVVTFLGLAGLGALGFYLFKRPKGITGPVGLGTRYLVSLSGQKIQFSPQATTAEGVIFASAPVTDADAAALVAASPIEVTATGDKPDAFTGSISDGRFLGLSLVQLAVPKKLVVREVGTR